MRVTNSFCTYTLNSSELNGLLNDLRLHPPVLFVGSGVSIWKPTGLASGGEFKQSMYSVLFRENFNLTPEEDSVLERLFENLPFEHLLELAPSHEKVLSLLRYLYNCSIPNPVHIALAAAYNNGSINNAITTNYDKCLESAFSGFPLCSFKLVVSEEEAHRYLDNSNEKCLFKIHGDIERTDDARPLFSLRDEGLLPVAKRNLLKKLLQGQTCLFLGYSGYDFDLCPVIQRIPSVRIIWIDRNPDPPSPNANNLLLQKSGTYIQADMWDFLKKWLNTSGSVELEMRDVTREDIKQFFSENEIAAWRIAVLNDIGAPSLTEQAIILSENKVDKNFLLWHKSRFLFNNGNYFTSADGYLKLCLNCFRSKTYGEISSFLLDATDAFRAGGGIIRAWGCLLFARIFPVFYMSSTSFQVLKGKYLLKKSLLLFDLVDLLRSYNLNLLTNLIKKDFTAILKECAKVSLSKGNRLDFQQVGLLAKRASIPLEEFESEDFYAPSDPEDGYLHLGYYLASVMCFLDKCRNIDCNSLATTEKEELYQTLLNNLYFCKVIGLNTGIWKLLAVNRILAEKGCVTSFTMESELLDSFNKCEYSRLMRYLQAKRYQMSELI